MNKSKHNATIAVYFDDLVEWYAKDELGFFASAIKQGESGADIRDAIKEARIHGVQVIVVYVRERNGSEMLVRQRLHQLQIEVDDVVAQDELLSAMWSPKSKCKGAKVPDMVQDLLMQSIIKHPDKLESAADSIADRTRPVAVSSIIEIKERALDIRDKLNDLIDVLDRQIYSIL